VVLDSLNNGSSEVEAAPPQSAWDSLKSNLAPLLDTFPIPVRTRHVVPHPVWRACSKGVPIPLYNIYQLRTLPMKVLVAHADHVCKTLGPSAMRAPPPPISEDLLIEWLMEARRDHLGYLYVVPHAVAHVYYQGIPVPLYQRHQLQSLLTTDLFEHAAHIYATLEGVSTPVPAHDVDVDGCDYLLLNWVMDVHEKHLDHHLAQLEVTGELRIAGQALSLEELQPVSDVDFHQAVMDSLLVHGLKATVATLNREADLNGAVEDASDHSFGAPGTQVPPCMPEAVVHQYNEARKASGRQELLVQEKEEEVASQRARLQELVDRVHELRVNCSLPSPHEEDRLNMQLMDQILGLQERRRTADVLGRTETHILEEVEVNRQEADKIQAAIDVRGQTIKRLQLDVQSSEEKLNEMISAAEMSEVSQAKRIRSLLQRWSAEDGPTCNAMETFTYVDSNKDGRLDWDKDEPCRFVRLLFRYHKVEVPPWPPNVWHELCRLCTPGFDADSFVDADESLKFARGCFEGALRVLTKN